MATDMGMDTAINTDTVMAKARAEKTETVGRAPRRSVPGLPASKREPRDRNPFESFRSFSDGNDQSE